MLDVVQAAARARGWRVCPETAGHDIVLVVGQDCGDGNLEPGDQIAVEGKLSANVKVLAQALPSDSRAHAPRRGTDWYAVCVPNSDADFRDVASALGIVVLRVYPERHPLDPCPLDALEQAPSRMRCSGTTRLALPDLDVVMAAGKPSPRALTPWKISAVRLCILGQSRDLTTDDFRPTPVRHRTFLDRGWMTPRGRVGRVCSYTLCDHSGRPDRAYPEIVAAIAREPCFGSGVLLGKEWP